MILNKKIKIGIIGLGYVGLPLLSEFYKKFFTLGFDVSCVRIKELKRGIDKTKEVNINDLINIKDKIFDNINYLKSVNFFIVTVPTPVNKKKKPDLSFLKNACSLVASVLKKGDIVVFESTGYPGLTEEICAPILQKKSLLLFNKDFYVGYSPERVNPGDKSKKLKNIKKIISGSKKPITTIIKNVYKKIIKAGVHEVSSIKVAEAAKVIENTQRDLNIALVNELSVIFKRLNIDTQEVLNAASTKWNFHHYKPGLVGGHCIGVDPYYLTYKAKKVGVNPKIILAGRRLNDGMAKYVAGNIEKKLSNKSRILIVGCTFKENCPDIRNSKIFDLYKFLSKKQRVVNIFDPIADKFDVKKEYGLNIFNKIPKLNYEVIVIAVPHKIFSKNLFPKLKKINKNKTLIFDLKSKLKINESFFRL